MIVVLLNSTLWAAMAPLDRAQLRIARLRSETAKPTRMTRAIPARQSRWEAASPGTCTGALPSVRVPAASSSSRWWLPTGTSLSIPARATPCLSTPRSQRIGLSSRARTAGPTTSIQLRQRRSGQSQETGIGWRRPRATRTGTTRKRSSQCGTTPRRSKGGRRPSVNA